MFVDVALVYIVAGVVEAKERLVGALIGTIFCCCLSTAPNITTKRERSLLSYGYCCY